MEARLLSPSDNAVCLRGASKITEYMKGAHGEVKSCSFYGEQRGVMDFVFLLSGTLLIAFVCQVRTRLESARKPGEMYEQNEGK
jgi:hypothetical protein